MSTKSFPEVAFVHAVDTEGPMEESLFDTFERLEHLFGLKFDPSLDILKALQEGKQELPSGIDAKVVSDCVSPKRITFIRDLRELRDMLHKLFDTEFRSRMVDDFGNPYRFDWYVLDHVGFVENPRRRLLGFHAILKEYLQLLENNEKCTDAIYWHYHGVSFSKAANQFGLNWNEPFHIEIFSRRLLDYGLFSPCFRPGGWIERPDMSAWLEQWIPIDFGNHSQSYESSQPDYQKLRFADWSRAPRTWVGYQPSVLDVQTQGEMRRTIYRSLSIDARMGSIGEKEIELAFEEALAGKRPVLSVTNHDNRDMIPEVESIWNLVRSVKSRYPNVKIRHRNSVDAHRWSKGLDQISTAILPKAEVVLQGGDLTVKSDEKIFGSQPFLAFKTIDGRYLHDNFAKTGSGNWYYRFDEQTVPIKALSQVGVAFHTLDSRTFTYVQTL